MMSWLRVIQPKPSVCLRVLLSLSIGFCQSGNAAETAITGIWANEGGDKVTQDELRVTKGYENVTGHVLNTVWNGTGVNLVGAHNEEVSFNLVLEAGGSTTARSVSVSLDTLTGPGGVQIHSIPATGNGVFDWTQRAIELFYVRYVQIRGLSFFGYGKWDERQIPLRFQRPYTGQGSGIGDWNSRPDHDKMYPDAMVPIELVPTFDIDAKKNQSIWTDIYISKQVPSGIFRGSFVVRENGVMTHTVPVALTVHPFALPDVPSAKTMINLDSTDIM